MTSRPHEPRTGSDRRPELFVRAFPLVATLLVLAAGGIVWLGWQATDRWLESTELLVARAMDETLTLLSSAVARDMRGAEASLLLPASQEQVLADPPQDISYNCARVFARFPYPESFFLWSRGRNGQSHLHLFNRADRPPPWASTRPPQSPFPVINVDNPAGLDAVVLKIASSDHRARFVTFETAISHVEYQVIARLFYVGSTASAPVAAVGFLVNLEWVESDYFGELLAQVARIGDASTGLSLAILDEGGKPVAMGREVPPDALKRDRTFPLLFSDPSLAERWQDPGMQVRRWRTRVAITGNDALSVTQVGARRTLFLICVAVVVLVLSLFLTARSVYQAVWLASMRADFVSTLTHELKTPLAGITLASQTLARGRYADSDVVRAYAGMLEHESARLRHLVENLLTFARLSDPPRATRRGLLHLDDLVEDALESFGPQLAEGGVDVRIDVPHGLPALAADRDGLLQVFENLIDNAIKYSGPSPSISIIASSTASMVDVWLSDKGPGIEPRDLPHLFDKFYRGTNAHSIGSGLGLAIVRQVVESHRGHVEISSTPGSGTQVHLSLPTQEDHDGKARARGRG